MKIGIVGAGYWGPNLIRNFEKVEGVEGVVVCDLLENRLKKVKGLFPSITTTTDINDLLKDKDVKAVAIATQPLATHYKLGKQVLEAGKHLFLEKPMTATSKEAKDLIDIAAKNKCIINVDHTFEYSAPVMMIKELIDSGELGEILTINMERLNLGLFQKDFNVIWDLCPHDFSMLNLWTGTLPESIYATGSAKIGPVEDDAHINLKYKSSSLTVHIHASWIYPQKIRKITIVGTKKMVVYDDVEQENKITLYDKGVEFYAEDKFEVNSQFGDVSYSYRHGDVMLPKINFTEPLLLECEEFVDAIKENKQTRTNGESGKRVLEMVIASNTSLKKGEEVSL